MMISLFLLVLTLLFSKNIPYGILFFDCCCPLYRVSLQWGGDVIFDLMLEQFTWFDFFACALPLMLGWYLWLFLMYKGAAGRASFSRLGGSGAGAGSAAVLGLGQDLDGGPGAALGSANVPDLMGGSKMPEGVSRVAASDVVFSAELEGAAGDGFSSSMLMGDVIAELKDVFAILAKEDGAKADFFRLIAAVKESYPGLGSHPGIAVLNAFVSEHAPFLLTLSELDSLWD